MIMKILDRILEKLMDNKWHSFEELEKYINLPGDKLDEVLSFLQKEAFIESQDRQLKITDKGLKLVNL